LNILTEPVWLMVLAGGLGLCVGSFLNVVIHRLPKMLERQWQAECAELSGKNPETLPPYNLLRPRSACPACRTPLGIHHNIPLISYLVLRGRCAFCGHRISGRYPVVEALTGALSVLVAWRFGWSGHSAGALLFIWVLIALTFIDLDTFLLPDSLTLPLLWAGLLFNIVGGFTALTDAVIGAAAGYLSLWTVYWVFKWATGKEGMGFGDFKLLAAIGAWLGWQLLPVTILLSSCVGAVIGLAMIAIRGGDRNTAIPFGPYLAIAGIIALFQGGTLNHLLFSGL
jgi:leader peptidase (prepilin peptidase)/N-methyltransferase